MSETLKSVWDELDAATGRHPQGPIAALCDQLSAAEARVKRLEEALRADTLPGIIERRVNERFGGDATVAVIVGLVAEAALSASPSSGGEDANTLVHSAGLNGPSSATGTLRRDGGETSSAVAWRRIEDGAPKDGRDILITTHGVGMVVRVGFWDEARGGQWSIWPGRDVMRPTHWMPVPTPPTTGEGA